MYKTTMLSLISLLPMVSFATTTTYSTSSSANNNTGVYSSSVGQNNSNNPYSSSKSQHQSDTQTNYAHRPHYHSHTGAGFIVEEDDTYFIPGRNYPRIGSNPFWMNMQSYNGVPAHAVVGGMQRFQPLFICRGNYNGGIHPGKLINGTCQISWGGHQIDLTQFQVLTSRTRLAWVPAGHGALPANAIYGGGENGHPLYICQARYAGSVYPGKVVGRNCNIAFQGREVTLPNYNVLVR